MPHPPLTQARLKELLHYDPETGHFTWLVSRNSNTAVAGSRAGSSDRKGYIRIYIDGVDRYAHRLAFIYMTGESPPEFVDHRNQVKGDNWWGNLRPATKQENADNVGPRGNNTSGHRGVTWHKQRRKWQAQGVRDGRRIYLGLYTALEEAAAVADAWRKEHHGEFYSCPQPQDPLSPKP